MTATPSAPRLLGPPFKGRRLRDHPDGVVPEVLFAGQAAAQVDVGFVGQPG